MAKRGAFTVTINGTDVTGVFSPVVQRIQVSDKAGTASDTATIELDDAGGKIVLPDTGADMQISLGFLGEGVGVVFIGKVDEVHSRGDRGGGMTLTISGKGVDSKGKAKEPQQKHFDKKSIKDMLTEAGKDANVSSVTVDPSFVSVIRAYEKMDDESFISFGERLADELGGTFKVVGNKAILAKRNGGTSTSGQALPSVTAARGLNLQTWDIAPVIGRSRYKKTRARYYDRKETKWKEVEVETELTDTDATSTARHTEPDEASAKNRAQAHKENSERQSGEGSVTIEGNVFAQPEAVCIVAGTRPGIDGSYRIDEVSHSYDRGGGFNTTLSLKQPQGSAGKDSRNKKKKGSSSSGGDFALPADSELG